MGGGPTQTTKASPPTIPPFLRGILGQEATSYLSAMQNLPSIQQLFGTVPQLNVPGITGGQQADINAIQRGQPLLTPQQQQAAGMMKQIADPTAEKQAFEQFATPEVMQQAALMGQGTSGAADYALAQAAIPYQLQAQQTELGAAQGLAGIGQQGLAQMVTALEAQGIPRDIALQKAQALFDQQQQRWGFGKDIQTNPFSLFGPTIGGGSTSVSMGGKF